MATTPTTDSVIRDRNPMTQRRYVRPYREADESSWLRCRVLSFLDSQYYDDVEPRRPTFDGPAVCLVAVHEHHEDSQVVGILDIEVQSAAATITTIATHPDHARRGIASALLDFAIPRLAEMGASTLDAWTREDAAANAWYQRHGFVERTRYLHVHKEWNDTDAGFSSPPGINSPVRVFAHAEMSQEDDLRARFRRVYVCRRYVRSVLPPSGTPLSD